ncbi:hypothetical protein D3C85_778550 [compost metagenome]
MVDPAITIDRGGLAREASHSADQRQAVPYPDQEVGDILPMPPHNNGADEE